MRPPNLNWTGSSRGDLARETNSPDPDSRVVTFQTDFHEIQLSTADRPLTVKHTLPSGWDLSPEERLATHLQNLCDRLEVPFVDTTPVLAEHAAQGELVYQTMDTHLSPVGHEIVANLLSTTLDSLETP